jgi:hypothetical protein
VEQQADVFAKRSQLEEFFSRLEENPNIPQELIGMVKLQLQSLMPMELPDIPPDEELQRQELEGLADEFCGAHFEPDNKGGYKLRNFRQIVLNATEIRKGKDNVFEVATPNGDYEFSGATSVAFERFLYFTGLMTLEQNKVPCPECGHLLPQDCPECGGLGWVLKSAPEKPPIEEFKPGKFAIPASPYRRLAINEAGQCEHILGVRGRCILNRGHEGDHQELRNHFEEQA